MAPGLLSLSTGSIIKIVAELEYDEEAYGRLLDIERELNRYVPIEVTGIDEAYNMESMEDALEMLKEYLRANFKNRCAYCNMHDEWILPLPFQIDHFIPRAKFEKAVLCT